MATKPLTRTWRYQAVANTFWNDQKVRAMTEDARWLLLYLLTCPERGTEGFYRLSAVLAAHRLGWTPERLHAAFSELAEVDVAHFNADADVVLVSRGLKYNPPRGDKQIRGALKLLDETRDAPDLFKRFLAAADKYAVDYAAAIRELYDLT